MHFHVAYNELEKASQFHQGLKPSIRHALGTFPLLDFRTMVEQALGMEKQHQYTMESQKSSGVDQPRGQDARRGNTGGPSHKRGKSQHQRHHPYRGKSSESGTSGGSTQRYRVVPKSGLGLVCFRCGEAHRRAECQWSGRFSIYNQDHKDVVCRRNPNGKLKWEPMTSSSSQGTVNMMTTAEQQFSVPPPQQRFYMPGTPQFFPMPGLSQFLAARTPALTTPVPSQFGAPCLPHPATPWGSSVNFTPGASSSASVSGAYVLPSMDGRYQGDVVTGTVLVDSFDAHALFDSSASFLFVSENFVLRAGLSVRRMGHPIVVSSAKGSISSCSVCTGCSVVLADEIFSANLVVISLESFDVILGMDCLTQYRAVISYFWKTVLL
jgi:hypothetical protein